ncbi:Na/Pi symporter [Enterococcus hailinensis]|uniref:Na/Pi symporter n=1 Tax=Enterococcus hailinensis TaxID=3238988 RepID=UPI0038B255E3
MPSYFFFAKRPTLHSIGQILFGFGALFYGLKLMGSAMDPLKDLPQFNQLMISVSHQPILGVGIGTLLTMVVQSSSATIGILQQLYMQGSVTLTAALPILFGDNISVPPLQQSSLVWAQVFLLNEQLLLT